MARRPRSEILKEYSQLRPEFLHQLSELLQQVLFNLPGTSYPEVPRFPDLARLASATGFFTPQELQTALKPDHHPVIRQVLQFLTDKEGFTGTATALLEQLPDPSITTPNHLSRLIRKYQKELTTNGINILRTRQSHSRRRLLELEKVCNDRPPAPQNQGLAPYLTRPQTPSLPSPAPAKPPQSQPAPPNRAPVPGFEPPAKEKTE